MDSILNKINDNFITENSQLCQDFGLNTIALMFISNKFKHTELPLNYLYPNSFIANQMYYKDALILELLAGSQRYTTHISLLNHSKMIQICNLLEKEYSFNPQDLTLQPQDFENDFEYLRLYKYLKFISNFQKFKFYSFYFLGLQNNKINVVENDILNKSLNDFITPYYSVFEEKNYCYKIFYSAFENHNNVEQLNDFFDNLYNKLNYFTPEEFIELIKVEEFNEHLFLYLSSVYSLYTNSNKMYFHSSEKALHQSVFNNLSVNDKNKQAFFLNSLTFIPFFNKEDVILNDYLSNFEKSTFSLSSVPFESSKYHLFINNYFCEYLTSQPYKDFDESIYIESLLQFKKLQKTIVDNRLVIKDQKPFEEYLLNQFSNFHVEENFSSLIIHLKSIYRENELKSKFRNNDFKKEHLERKKV